MNLQSKGHTITTNIMEKEALSFFDDKRYLLKDGTHETLAWGHYAIPEEVRAKCEMENRNGI